MLREARDAVEFQHSGSYDGGTSGERWEGTFTGIEAFRHAQLEIKYWIEVAHAHETPVSPEDIERNFTTLVYNRYESGFGTYFRLLCMMMDRIRREQHRNPAWEHFGNILRNQLTSHEVVLCGYNGLVEKHEKFKALLSEFRIFKYLPHELGRETLEKFYPAYAFVGRDELQAPAENRLTNFAHI